MADLESVKASIINYSKAAIALDRADYWRVAWGTKTDKETFLLNNGMSHIEAIAFIKQAPLTTDEEWLIGKGTPARDARALIAQKPLGIFESSLMMKGVPAAIARQQADMPATEYDIKSTLVKMMETPGLDHPALNRIESAIEELSISLRRQPLTRAQLFETQFTLSGGRKIDLGQGLTLAVADYYLSSHKPTIVAVNMPAKDIPNAISAPAASEGTVDNHAHAKDKNITAGVDVVITAVAKPANKAPSHETIMKLLAGKNVASETITALQGDLNRAGFHCGKADGVAGSQTWKAIAAYAKSENLGKKGVTKPFLREMEDALREVGYNQIDVDGVIDAETRRATEKFFRLRQSSLGEFKPADAQEPDVAALAAIQSGRSKKRGLVAAGK